jgi:hypothetical protein
MSQSLSAMLNCLLQIGTARWIGVRPVHVLLASGWAENSPTLTPDAVEAGSLSGLVGDSLERLPQP